MCKQVVFTVEQSCHGNISNHILTLELVGQDRQPGAEVRTYGKSLLYLTVYILELRKQQQMHEMNKQIKLLAHENDFLLLFSI